MQPSPTQDASPESTASSAGPAALVAPGQGTGGRVKRGSHPRPQLRRGSWTSLDGLWSFALDSSGSQRRWHHPSEVVWDRTILVPFAPETPRSGIGETGFIHACWYGRTITTPDLSRAAGSPGSAAGAASDRLLLHFGAVDYQATVWIDGNRAGEHEGGYTPFTIDITEWTRTPGEHAIVVLAEDDPTDLAKPRGKQDWQLHPHSIWYPRATGIWQTVWLERVPATRIASLRWRCNLERWEIELATSIQGAWRDGMRLRVKLQARDTVLADDVYVLLHGELYRRIALSDPGIDDSRNALLWSPESPTIIDAEIELLAADGTGVDRVRSYTALRAIGVQGDRVVLNGRPYPLLLVLDQGYWPETGQTAPDTQALRRDVLLAKAMGFNGVRKHQKIEDPRFLYWADHLGLLVWEEMPSAYRYTQDSIRRVTREWMAVIERDYSHPSIIAWVPFNESWGVPNLPDNPAERHFVQAIYHLTKTLDPTRLVVGNDGWESVATDVIGIHDYLDTPERMARRYQSHEIRPQLLGHERPGGRLLVLGNEEAHAVHPIILSEFGGIALVEGSAEGSWGYSRCGTAEQLAATYAELLGVVRSLQLLAGFCYTQFTDTYQEANGLLRADRTPKIPIEQIHAATRGRLTGALDEFSIQLIDSPRHEGYSSDAFEPA
jgi:beta-galactosidase/beta-glucuronidase